MAETLRNFAKFQQSIRNFAWLQDVASGGMDLDFFVERNGKFLVVEGKPYSKGVVVPWGQHLALKRLAAVPNFRVYIAGEADKGERIHLMRLDPEASPVVRRGGRVTVWWPPSMFIPSDKDGLRAIVESWWQDAEAA